VHRAVSIVIATVAALVVSVHGQQTQPTQPAQQTPQTQQPVRPSGNDQGFRFKSGVELINVTATVSDVSGRFVSGLRAEDFLVYEDNQPVQVTHFSSERVPVSLGIALDTSGSMNGEKLQAAQSALDRFLFDLLDRQDEIFLYRFSNDPVLLQSWTTDRPLLSRALGRVVANGGTAMYDTVAEAIPLAQRGQSVKKALLVISDGNDTASRISISEVKQLIRESEVLVYAIGIDGTGEGTTTRRAPPPQPRWPIPIPFPGGRRPGWPQPPPGGGGGWPRNTNPNDERVNIVALRDMTDDSGGRTEIIRNPVDLNPATANIADELSKQYYLGYPSTSKKDGRWHSIRVELRNGNYRVRARRGYIAS
jgi:Ca-activated chloride channel homolog